MFHPVCSHHALITGLNFQVRRLPTTTISGKSKHPTMIDLMPLISSTQLWAVMLRNSSELFVHQCAKSKFLDTLEDVLASQRTSPVVRERLLDVLAAAAYASSGTAHKNESSFRLLWRKVKPAGKPDEVGLYLLTNSFEY
jgi:hypothetical protein